MDELISREAVHEMLENIPIREGDRWFNWLQKACMRLGELPTIEPRKGKWIYGENEIGNDGYYCSECGNFVPWKYGEYDIDFIKESGFVIDVVQT